MRRTLKHLTTAALSAFLLLALPAPNAAQTPGQFAPAGGVISVNVYAKAGRNVEPGVVHLSLLILRRAGTLRAWEHNAGTTDAQSYFATDWWRSLVHQPIHEPGHVAAFIGISVNPPGFGPLVPAVTVTSRPLHPAIPAALMPVTVTLSLPAGYALQSGPTLTSAPAGVAITGTPGVAATPPTVYLSPPGVRFDVAGFLAGTPPQSFAVSLSLRKG